MFGVKWLKVLEIWRGVIRVGKCNTFISSYNKLLEI